MALVPCSVCRQHVTPIAPSSMWRVALFGGAVLCAALVMGSALLGIGLLMSAPIVAILGIGIVPPLAAKVGQTPVCPRCDRYVSREVALPVAEATYSAVPAQVQT